MSVDHWGGNGSPILFGIGGEANVFAYTETLGFLWEHAKQLQAMVVFAEHRFYGQSLPFGKQSFCWKNLGLFNSEQALADFAANIPYIKKKYKASKSPVIIIGGSYGGILAAWFRMKYSHLVVGAIAASAPLLIFPGNGYNCEEFAQRSTNSFDEYGQCAQLIRKSWQIIQNKGKTANGMASLSNVFKICPGEQLKKPGDVRKLTNYITNAFQATSILNYNNPSVYAGSRLPAYPVKEVCKKVTSNQNPDDDSLIRNIFSGISVYYNFSGSLPCTTFIPIEYKRGFSYQVCSELYLLSCSNGITDMYLAATNQSFSLDLVQETKASCLKKYGVTPDPYRVKRVYGSKKNLLTATNIIFSNGLLDPYAGAGVTRENVNGLQLNPSVYILEIPSAAHREDMSFSGQNDPLSLRDARTTEVAIIQSWIQEYRMQQAQIQAG